MTNAIKMLLQMQNGFLQLESTLLTSGLAFGNKRNKHPFLRM
jgi:hypothetical protein